MNKKGFTIVEIIAVITILSLLMVLVVPSLNKSSSAIKKKAFETKVTMIENAAKLYAQDNTNAILGDSNEKSTTITVQVLIDGGYLTAESDIYILDPRDNSKHLNNMQVTVTVKRNNKKVTVSVDKSFKGDPVGSQGSSSETRVTITLNANGGLLSNNSSTTTISSLYNNTYGTLETPKRSGYTFVGWYTQSTGGTQVTSTTRITTTTNHTLYARWEQGTPTVKVTLYDGVTVKDFSAPFDQQVTVEWGYWWDTQCKRLDCSEGISSGDVRVGTGEEIIWYFKNDGHVKSGHCEFVRNC